MYGQQDGVAQGSNAYLLLCMTCFEGLAFTFDGKNQTQWGASCNI